MISKKITGVYGARLLLTLVSLIIVAPGVSADPINIKKLSNRKWTQVESQNFLITSDASRAKTTKLNEQLEQFRAFAKLLTGIKELPFEQKTHMFLANSPAIWKAMGLPNTLSSVYSRSSDGTPVIYANLAGFSGESWRKGDPARASVLSMITFDLFSQAGVSADLPLWFRRGLALYLGTYSEPKNGIVLGDLEVMRGRFSSVFNNAGVFIDFDTQELFNKNSLRSASSRSDSEADRVNRFYVQSFTMVHYFNADAQGRKKLDLYLRLLKSGKSVEEATLQAFEMSFDELNRTLKRYLIGNKIYSRVFDKEAITQILQVPVGASVSKLSKTDFLLSYARAVNGMGAGLIEDPDKQKFLNQVIELNPNKAEQPLL